MNKTPVTYKQLKQGWDQAATSGADAAIHPSGRDRAAYEESGIADIHKLWDLIRMYIGQEAGPLTVLDFGAGNGRMAIPLTYMADEVYAVDMSYGMLQQIPKIVNLFPILSIDCDFELPVKADVAVSVSVFIHNSYEDGKRILKAISRNMKPGAHAFLQIPLYEQSKEPANWTDVGVWTIEDLNYAAEEAGMGVLLIKYNPGSFSYDHIGPNHAEYQVLVKLPETEEKAYSENNNFGE